MHTRKIYEDMSSNDKNDSYKNELENTECEKKEENVDKIERKYINFIEVNNYFNIQEKSKKDSKKLGDLLLNINSKE